LNAFHLLRIFHAPPNRVGRREGKARGDRMGKKSGREEGKEKWRMERGLGGEMRRGANTLPRLGKKA
jgi:hypothetical protein